MQFINNQSKSNNDKLDTLGEVENAILTCLNEERNNVQVLLIDNIDCLAVDPFVLAANNNYHNHAALLRVSSAVISLIDQVYNLNTA